MPRFCVTFPQPLVYLAGHPKGERLLTELLVSAPDAAAALVHAIRTVSGDPSGAVVTPAVETPYVPPIEVVQDTCEVFGS